MKTARLLSGFMVLATAQFAAVAQTGFTDAETAALTSFLREKFTTNVAMVIGLVDEHGPRVFSGGKSDNGANQTINGDTLFEIGSCTKTFTVLLLLDMVERGELKLDDPVAKYLPASVRLPTHGGKPITLLDLATHTSGLPRDPTNLSPGRGLPDNAFRDYTAEKLYAFLSGFILDREPGSKFEYSNLGMALLGHVLTLKAGTSYESLVVDRICRPLEMTSTRIVLTPELKVRLAAGHDPLRKPAPNWEFQVYDGAGGLRSTANDLLKYVSANLGLTQSRLTPLMEQTHVVRHRGTPSHGDTAMAWMARGEGYRSGMELRGHAGGTGGYETFIGFNKSQGRGVVVLSSQQGGLPPETIGWFLLKGVSLNSTIIAGLTRGSEIVGNGAAVGLDAKTGLLRIMEVLPDSPASEAGLSPGLLVQTIDGVATAGKSLPECVGLIRGPVGTRVRLEVIDPKQNKTKQVELTRRKIQT